VTGLAQQLTPTFRRAVNLLKTNFQHVFDVPPVGAIWAFWHFAHELVRMRGGFDLGTAPL
jgi:hypothetical protein